MAEPVMTIKYDQPVTVILKRLIKDNQGNPVIENGFPAIEEFVIKGKVSGIFQPDWCSIYQKDSTVIIDLRP